MKMEDFSRSVEAPAAVEGDASYSDEVEVWVPSDFGDGDDGSDDVGMSDDGADMKDGV